MFKFSSLFVYLFLFSVYSSLFSQEKFKVTGHAGGLLWYANWNSESSLEYFNMVTLYDIKPTVLKGISATLSYQKGNEYYGGVFLEYITGKYDQQFKENVLANNDVKYRMYQMFKGSLLQRLPDSTYVVLRSVYGSYKGNLTLDGSWASYGLPVGSVYNVNSRWLRMDALWLFYGGPIKLFTIKTNFSGNVSSYTVVDEFYLGLGYRYIRYNKPEVFYWFYGHEVDKDDSGFGEVEMDELISVKIEEAQTSGHYLVLGMWHPSYLGLPSPYPIFMDFLIYIGQANISSKKFKLNDKMGMGLEFDFGLSAYMRIYKHYHMSLRLGYQFQKHLMTIAEELEKEGDRQKYLGVYAHEYWYGPFIGAMVSF